METLLKRLNDAQVRYVVIGGQAMLQQHPQQDFTIECQNRPGR